jgi:hypothetical protein
VGLERFELSTPALSEQCSNQLSYRPEDFNQRTFSGGARRRVPLQYRRTAVRLYIRRETRLFEIPDVCDRYLWSIVYTLKNYQ